MEESKEKRFDLLDYCNCKAYMWISIKDGKVAIESTDDDIRLDKMEAKELANYILKLAKEVR